MQFCFKTVFKSGKDSCSAQKLKEEGNKYFVAGKYQRALDKYNQSLILAEEGGGPSSLGVVLGNRSAALYHLRQYAACVQDVDTALATSYPAHLELKLLERRARCFCSLGDQRRFLKEIENIETKHCDDEVWRKKQENLVSELRKLSCKVKDANILNNQQEEVTLLKSRNKDFEGFSDLLEMRYSEDRGRYMVASEDIAVGTVLGAERPICSMLTRQAAETQVCTTLVVYVGMSVPHARSYICIYQSVFQCSACCRPLTSYWLPCGGCARARFCSLACRVAGARAHGLECGLATDLAPVLGQVRGAGEGAGAGPEYYRLALLALADLAVEEVVELEAGAGQPPAAGQREGSMASMLNLVRCVGLTFISISGKRVDTYS